MQAIKVKNRLIKIALLILVGIIWILLSTMIYIKVKYESFNKP